MKKQAFKTLSTYSEEDLDFLKEFVKAKIIKMDKYSSAILPVITAILIAVFTMTFDIKQSVFLWTCFVIFMVELLFIFKDFLDNFRKLGFYNIMLELIEKVEQVNGHTFNDSLVKEYNQSLTISEEGTEEPADDDQIEVT